MNGRHSPYSTFQQHIFEANQPYQPMVDTALRNIDDPFLEGKAIRFQRLMRALQDARQEYVDSQTAMQWAQCLKLLANNALMATCMELDTSIARFEEGDKYSLLHTTLMRESLQHVGDDNTTANARELLYFQLQAVGRPQSPPIPDPPLSNLMDRFNCMPFKWKVNNDKPFIQDGGDDDRYY
jgi:hypothetical protein